MADYYSDSEDAGPDTSAESKGDEMDDSALLPKSIFGKKELKVGNKCEFKIEHVFEDEVEVSYVPHKDKKDKDDDSDEDEDKSEDKPKKRKRHRDYSDDDEFLSDQQVAMMNMGPPGAGPGAGAV